MVKGGAETTLLEAPCCSGIGYSGKAATPPNTANGFNPISNINLHISQPSSLDCGTPGEYN